MNLLPGESILVTSNQDKVVLTDHRICMTNSLLGQSSFISIYLEDISSIEIKRTGNSMFLFVAILITGLSLLGTVLSGDSENIMPGFAFGLLFFFFWLSTYKRIVSISSKGGGPLNFIVGQIIDEKVYEFLHKVSKAKQDRIKYLHVK